jgi:hypothetical protein
MRPGRFPYRYQSEIRYIHHDCDPVEHVYDVNRVLRGTAATRRRLTRRQRHFYSNIYSRVPSQARRVTSLLLQTAVERVRFRCRRHVHYQSVRFFSRNSYFSQIIIVYRTSVLFLKS